AESVGYKPKTFAELVELLENGPSEELWTSAPAPPEGLYLHHVRYPEEALRAAPDTPSRGEGPTVADDEGPDVSSIGGADAATDRRRSRRSRSDYATSRTAEGASDAPGDAFSKES
ncbi:MAG: hypothetical protein ACOC8K_09010, partial [Gemmatimonadota bacterium]